MPFQNTKPSLNKGDYRPKTDAKSRTKPSYNAGDYRPFNFYHPPIKAKKTVHGKRLAAGVRDPWGGFGVRRG